MPDEANEILTTLVSENSGTPIVAVQSGDGSGNLFGKPLTTYGTANGDGSAARVSQILAQRFQAPAFQAQIQDGLASGFARTVQNGAVNTSLDVRGFGTARAGNGDLIVVVLNPESGRQPGLVAPYLAETLRGLKDLPEASAKNGGIHLSVYATSGGVAHDIRPGQVSQVSASLLVGSEVVKDANGQKAYDAVIKFADRKGDSKTLFRKRATNREEAEKLAGQEFLSNESPQLSKWIASAKTHGDVSLTASFFVGPEIKEKGDRLGITNANMEDYHTLRLLSLVNSSSINRVVTDPSHLPDPLRKRIAEWSKEPGYTAGTYADAILWGLKGCPLNAVPESARWKALVGESTEEIAKYLATVPGKAPGFVLDPFFAEIASEFINELAAGRAFLSGPEGTLSHAGILSTRTSALLSPGNSHALDELVAKKSDALKARAQTIQSKLTAGASEAELRAEVFALLEDAAAMDVPRDTALFREVERRLAERAKGNDEAAQSAARKVEFLKKSGKLRFLSRTGTENKVGRDFPMETWVVNIRWDGNSGRQLRYISDGLNVTQQDRALYRSGLITLGREKAHDVAIAERKRVNAERIDPSCLHPVQSVILPHPEP